MSKQTLGFLLGAVAIVIIAALPVIGVVIASTIASALGCTLNEGDVHPCLWRGYDLGELLYGLFVLGWLGIATLPLGAMALGVLLLVWIVVAVVDWRRRANARR